MTLPKPVERLWDELERVRGDVLREAAGLSQRQADWKPSERFSHSTRFRIQNETPEEIPA